MTDPPEVVTVGEAMLLLVADPGVPFVHANTFRRSIAGAETNVAIGLARLGHPVEWIGRLGADPAGQAVARLLRADGVGMSHVRFDPEAPTGLLLRDSHPQRAIDVQYARAGSAATRMRPDDLGAEMLRGSRLLYVTGITAMISESCRRSVVRLLELARECEVTVGFDPNIRTKLGGAEQWRDLVGPLLARAGLVFAGEDELAALTGRPAADAAAALLAAGVETVVVWSSGKAATAHTRSGTATRERVPVSAVDPVGAGDAFAAGYLSAWLRGLPVSRALTEAAAVAALVVQSPTDTDGLPDRVGRDRAVAAFTSSVETVHR